MALFKFSTCLLYTSLCRAEIPHFPQIGSDSGINCRYGSVCNRGRGLAHLLYPDISGGIYAGSGCFHFIVYRDIPVFQYQFRIDIRIGDGVYWLLPPVLRLLISERQLWMLAGVNKSAGNRTGPQKSGKTH